MGSLLCSCAKVREPLKLWFGVVRGVGRGIAVLDGVPRPATGGGCFEAFCFRLSLLDFGGVNRRFPAESAKY